MGNGFKTPDRLTIRFSRVPILVIQYNPLPESHSDVNYEPEKVVFFLRDFLPTIYTEPPGPPKKKRHENSWPSK